jgi:hypothetical protein
MGDPDGPPLRAEDIVTLFARHGVDYVVVGGLAATAHGATRVTFDIDVVPDWEPANLERLAAALRECGAEFRAPGSTATTAIPVDATALRQFEVSTWRTELGDVEVIAGTPSTAGRGFTRFGELTRRSSERRVFGTTIRVAALSDIIDAKQALGRETDLVSLPELHRLPDRASQVE